MRNINFKTILLLSLFTVALSCQEPENTSIVSSFALFPAENNTGALVIPEYNNGTYSFDYSLSDEQITDLHLEVAVGSQSTATEGEDFILNTHTVNLLAFQGEQEGFPISITVLDDAEVEEDETIYLTFTSDVPSGIDETQQLVITIPGCTEPQPEDDLFVGAYSITSTAGADEIGGGAPLFNNQTITLAVEGPGTRSFNAVAYQALGIGNPAQKWILKWDACDAESFVFSTKAVNINCGIPLYLKPTGALGTGDIDDDSQFTVIVSELDGPDGCGADGSHQVTLSFTKL